MQSKTINKILLIIFLVSIFSLCFPKSAKAFLGTGLFDYFQTALEGIEELAGPIASRIILMVFTSFAGIGALWASGSLLQMAMNPEWLTLKNPVVTSGLYFVTGLTNLCIILVFLAIAIGYILKIESFQAKKALPKLILVALFINFLPFFLGIIIDITTILHRTILGSETNLVMDSISALFGGVLNIATGIIGWVMFLAGMFMIPFVSPFYQLGLIIVIGTVFLPSFLTWLVQTFLAFLLSMIFFTMAFVFGARIFGIWFLTILSPLALLCLVLPQTEKHWKEWLHHFMSWCLYGIIVLLVLVVGLKGAQYIYPRGIPPQAPGLGWFALPNALYYYFFLFVFISIVMWLSKSAAPQMADFIINQATFLGGQLTAAGKTVGKGIARRAQRGLADQKEVEKTAEEKKKAKMPLSRTERLALWGPSRKMTGALDWAHRQATGVTPEEVETRKMKKVEAEAMKIETPETFRGKIIDAKRMGDVAALRAYASAGIEKGREFKKIVSEVISNKEAEKLGREANRVGRSKEAERIARAYIDKMDEAAFNRMGFKSYADLEKDEQDEWNAKGYKTIADKLIGEAKGDDIKDFAKNFWDVKKHPEYMEAIQTFWGGPQIRKAAEEFGRGFIMDYTEPIEVELKKFKTLPPSQAEKEYKSFVYTNPGRARYHETTAAQELGLGSIYALAPDAVRKKYDKRGGMRAILAEKP